jgi:hypothetical protein
MGRSTRASFAEGAPPRSRRGEGRSPPSSSTSVAPIQIQRPARTRMRRPPHPMRQPLVPPGRRDPFRLRPPFFGPRLYSPTNVFQKSTVSDRRDHPRSICPSIRARTTGTRTSSGSRGKRSPALAPPRPARRPPRLQEIGGVEGPPRRVQLPVPQRMEGHGPEEGPRPPPPRPEPRRRRRTVKEGVGSSRISGGTRSRRTSGSASRRASWRAPAATHRIRSSSGQPQHLGPLRRSAGPAGCGPAAPGRPHPGRSSPGPPVGEGDGVGPGHGVGIPRRGRRKPPGRGGALPEPGVPSPRPPAPGCR